LIGAVARANADENGTKSMSAVSLVEVTASDGPELVRAHIESRDYHQPWVTAFTDAAQFAAWFARVDSERMMSFVARHREGGIVGLCTLSEIVRGRFQSAYLGFHGMVAFGGQGLMTEAVKLTIKHAFGPVGLHRLEANIQPDNSRSIALVRRLAFTKEGYSRDYLHIGGRWRDHERWALLASDVNY
jgi:ribosomal-protein-alanine N-acetyltransferase